MTDNSPWHTPESTAQLIDSLHSARRAEHAGKTSNGFVVSTMESVPVGTHPASVDTLHTYMDIRSCSKPGGGSMDMTMATVFYYHDAGFPDKRYIIVADHATGARIKVDLPPLPGKESEPTSDGPDEGSMYELVREQKGGWG